MISITKLKNLISISSLFVLMFYYISLPVQSFAYHNKSSEPSDGLERVTVVTQEEEVPLFKDVASIEEYISASDDENLQSSEIITYLSNGNEVEIIEKFELYSHVRYIKQNVDSSTTDSESEPPVYEGYVENNYLDLYNNEGSSKEISTDTETNVEKEDSTNSTTGFNNDEGNNESNTEQNDIPTNVDVEQKSEESTLKIPENNEEENQDFTTFSTFSTLSTPTQIRGIAGKAKTNIRTSPSTKVKVLTKVDRGTVLSLKQYNEHWYEVTINGKKGYIHKKHFEAVTNNQQKIRGVTKKSPTNVREQASTKSKRIHSYPIGSVIEYYTFSEHWYEVRLNGNRLGYIHKKHVENTVAKQETKLGVALNYPTNVRARASTQSEIIHSYTMDDIVEYKTFTTYWHEVVFEKDGQKKSGYIHRNHLGDPTNKTFRGVTLREPTYIRSSDSTKSEPVTTLPPGTLLEYESFRKYWYKVTIKVNGETRTGYIHEKHVENVKEKTYRGIANKNTTYIRSTPSTKSEPLRTYPIGTILNYHLYNDNWYQVVINNKTFGYIHKKHIQEIFTEQKSQSAFGLKSPTNVRAKPTTQSDVIYTYKQGTKIKYKTFSKYWHQVTVKINGKERTGYIHVNHVGNKVERQTNTHYNDDFKNMVDKQMIEGSPKKDGAGNVNAPRGLVEFYSNPLNFAKGTPEYFQFLVLSKSANVTADQLNQILKGTGLEGYGEYFIEAGNRYNVNEVYLVAHALHETGNGNSTLARGVPVDENGKVTRDSKGNIAETSKTAHTVYNLYGYGAYDSCPIDCGAKYAFEQGWFNIPAAIVGGAQRIITYINRGQDTLYKMKWNPVNPGYSQYATHVQWAVLQTYRIYDVYSSLLAYDITFDVPTFNNMVDYKNTYGKTTANVNMRSETTTGNNNNIITTIPSGQKIKITGSKITRSNPYSWYKVEYNGRTGWVSAEYVNLIY